MVHNIAIDGPAGAGKSTVAKKVAKELSFVYVDTGAMYRAMALYLLRKGVNRENLDEIGEACQNAEISIEYQNGEQIVLLDGENVNDYLRTEEVSGIASRKLSSAAGEGKASGSAAQAGKDHECRHGRERYRNNHSAGCGCQNLPYSKFSDQSTPPLSGISGKRRGL